MIDDKKRAEEIRNEARKRKDRKMIADVSFNGDIKREKLEIGDLQSYRDLHVRLYCMSKGREI